MKSKSLPDILENHMVSIMSGTNGCCCQYCCVKRYFHTKIDLQAFLKRITVDLEMDMRDIESRLEVV